jgi:hypothetical protein
LGWGAEQSRTVGRLDERVGTAVGWSKQSWDQGKVWREKAGSQGIEAERQSVSCKDTGARQSIE